MNDLLNPEFMARLEAAGQVGMTTACWAARNPDKVAVYDPDGTPHTLAKVTANANKLARLLRARGLKAGDSLALLCDRKNGIAGAIGNLANNCMLATLNDEIGGEPSRRASVACPFADSKNAWPGYVRSMSLPMAPATSAGGACVQRRS